MDPRCPSLGAGTYLIDVLTRPTCRGRRNRLAVVHDPDGIHSIFTTFGLDSEPAEIAPARPAPQARLLW